MIVHSGRIGVKLKDPKVGSPELSSVFDPATLARFRKTPPFAKHAVRMPDLDVFWWARVVHGRRAALLDEYRSRPTIAAAWPEAPPCPDGSERADSTGAPVEVPASWASVMPTVGVRVAVVERAWSAELRNRRDQNFLGKDPDGAPTIGDAFPKEFTEHGDLCVSTIIGVPNRMNGVAQRAHVGAFSTLKNVTTPGVVGPVFEENVPEAVLRAVTWLSEGEGDGVLLVQIQHFLMEGQVEGAPGWHRSPGGRVCAGPIDADPAVRAVMEAATAAGHLVVIPAGNGRQDLKQVWDDEGIGVGIRLTTGSRAALRVGASDGQDRIALSNYGLDAVDLHADGSAVTSVVYDQKARQWRAVRWSGTSPAAAMIAAVAARLAGSGIAMDDVKDRLLARHGVGEGW